MANNDRMTIRNGEVEICDGEVRNIDFQNCKIYIDLTSKLVNCTTDVECEVIGTNG